jgi:biopolymer transport protein ExbD
MARRGAPPEVNAGSMADIAFLLLIFFLVTTTIETDAGLDRMLPPIEPPDSDVVIKQKNIFLVNVNKYGQILADEQPVELSDLRTAVIAFLDNGGLSKSEATQDNPFCDYCQGLRDASSSDNPDKAIVSLKSDRETKYGVYIAVQNEIVGAYNDLRNREAQRLYRRNFTEMDDLYNNPETPSEVREDLKDKVKRIQDLFPQKFSEAETAIK